MVLENLSWARGKNLPERMKKEGNRAIGKKGKKERG
jgi:hypothetical protein